MLILMVGSQLEQAEPEFSADVTIDNVDSTETPKKSSSKSSVKSKPSQTSLNSASGSVVSVKNETSPNEVTKPSVDHCLNCPFHLEFYACSLNHSQNTQ